MAVIRITEYKTRDTISLLREALEMALAGKIKGVCLAMKFDQINHGIALTDEYRSDPSDVLIVTSRIDFEVNMIIREPKAHE